MLTVEFSKQRQRRLLECMQRRRLDAVVIGASPHVYYFATALPSWLHQAGFVLFADGRSMLIWPNEPPSQPVAADEVVTYEANALSTLRQEQPAFVAEKALAALGGRAAISVGLDASAVTSQVALWLEEEAIAIDPDLWQLRRRKDPDELDLMKTAIGCCEAMYAGARQIVQPGVPELEVFGELHKVAVQTAAEPLSALLGNDYACGVLSGPPRKDRRAKEGELYILDLGPAYRGYFSDNARTFAVDRRPTDAQHQAWEAVAGALRLVESIAKPGVRCVDIFRAVDEHFKATRGTGMPHHLGHGVGLQPHEYPHLNPNWNDTLMEGELFTAEPGQYAPQLGGGIRLENQYLVTKHGVENLVSAPLELA
jgi:Xaa-Pro dipeptidase